MRRGPVRVRLAAALTAAAWLLSACGIPTDGQPFTVSTADVPYGLLDRTTTPNPTPTTTPGVPVVMSTMYLVNEQQQLVAVPVQQTQATLAPLLQTLLNRLALGPGDRERSRFLGTDLSPGSAIVLKSVASGIATIEVQTTSQDPIPVKLPIAIGQIVLTAMSVVGVDQVQFLRGGLPVGVPRPPDGDSTSFPLTAADYTSVLAPGQTPVTRTVPLAGPAASTTTTESP